MRSPVRALLSLALTAGMSLSCGRFLELPTDPGGGDPVDPSATLSVVQQTIFTPTCASVGCHDALGAPISAGLELTAGRAHANLVGRPSTGIPTMLRVAPGSPEESYLMRKITGTQPIAGARMPLIGAPLTDAQIRLIRDWIRRGAPDD